MQVGTRERGVGCCDAEACDAVWAVAWQAITEAREQVQQARHGTSSRSDK